MERTTGISRRQPKLANGIEGMKLEKQISIISGQVVNSRRFCCICYNILTLDTIFVLYLGLSLAFVFVIIILWYGMLQENLAVVLLIICFIV